MLKTLRDLLVKVIDEIDAGNSNLTESEILETIEIIKRLSNNKEDFSKYSAANYLKVSRATFDNYIAEGKLPHGVKKQGFKELRWYKEDLDRFKQIYKP